MHRASYRAAGPRHESIPTYRSFEAKMASTSSRHHAWQGWRAALPIADGDDM